MTDYEWELEAEPVSPAVLTRCYLHKLIALEWQMGLWEDYDQCIAFWEDRYNHPGWLTWLANYYQDSLVEYEDPTFVWKYKFVYNGKR